MSMLYPWHEAIWQVVHQAKQQDHLHHALLFTGQEGCGHEAFVHGIAQNLLCLQPSQETGLACRQCHSCQIFASKAHPDFCLISLQDDRQSILIEQIRELNYFLSLSRSCSPRRLAVILPAERMNLNAANSLLKNLEEPASGTHILLFSAHPATVLPTIRSRCQDVHLPLPTQQQALAWLSEKPLQHSAEELLEMSWGRPLAALQMDNDEWLSQRALWLEHLLALHQGQGNIAEISQHWEKFDKNTLINWQLDLLQQLAKQHITAKNLPISLSQDEIWKRYDKLLELKHHVNHSLNTRLYIESMLMIWYQSV